MWRSAEAARTGKPLELDSAGEFVRALTAAAAKPGARLLLGVLDGQPVATIYGVPLRGLPTKAQVALLAVEPALWRQGIGTRMLHALTDTLSRQGCRELRMNVDPENHRARALYERQGWRHFGETEQVADANSAELIYRTDLTTTNAE